MKDRAHNIPNLLSRALRPLDGVQKRFYAAEKLNDQWRAAVGRPLIEGANTPAEFDQKASDLFEGTTNFTSRTLSSQPARGGEVVAERNPSVARYL